MITQNNHKSICVTIIESFFILFAIMRLFSISTIDFFSLILFILIFTFLKQTKNVLFSTDSSTKKSQPSILFSVFLTVLVFSARYTEILQGLSSKLFCLIILCCSALGFFFLFYYLFLFCTKFLADHTLHLTATNTKKLSALTFILCLLFWFPYFLYEFPGVMTPDSINQYAQIIGVYAPSNHHPWVHTNLIALFYSIGLYFTHSPIISIAFYTVFQMCFMAFAASYTIFVLSSLQYNRYIIYLTMLFYAFMPYHGIFAVTIWKDIIFAGAFCIFTCSLVLLLLQKAEQSNHIVFHYISYFLSGIMLCLFRTNGWYVFLFTVPFLLFAFRKKIRSILFSTIGIIIIVLIIKIPVMQSFHIIQPDFAESLSIPAQQIARVYAMDQSVSSLQNEQLSKILDTTALKEAYQPDVYDPVKYLIRSGNQDYLIKNKLQYLQLWLQIGLQHPKEYFDAFVAQTCGYWYPDTICEIGLNDGIYQNDFSLHWSPVLKGNFFIKVKEIIFKLYGMIPLFGLLFSMGSIFWVIIFNCFYLYQKKAKKITLLYLPAVFLVLTLCLATPVAAEFRYVYSLFFTLPIYLFVPLHAHN